MRYDTLKTLSCEDFRRLTGVKPKTFGVMLGVLRFAEEEKHRQGGIRAKLPLEDRLLMALEYWREYRTYFHVSHSYGVSESSCWKTVRWIEDTLIKHKAFHVPGRKAPLKSDVEFDVILVDATETPCERPKKSRSVSTPARKSAIPLRRKSS
jgi:Helix-turn-helix of DDE superfamily endonuclease